MAYSIRPATLADIPHIVQHRELMFREMGIPAEFEHMAVSTDLWLRHAIPAKGEGSVRKEKLTMSRRGVQHLRGAPPPLRTTSRIGTVGLA